MYLNQWKNNIDLEYSMEFTSEVYPTEDKVYSALNLTSPNRIKAVVIGQDPYHGEGQANGLAFSVNSDVPVPPSLRNILKKVEIDCGVKRTNPDLSDWAEQGVLLLNTVLTVQKGRPKSHIGMGWEKITDNIISLVSELNPNTVYLAWGRDAAAKVSNVKNGYILKAPHPSPLSAYRGFFEADCFARTNELLSNNGIDQINWTGGK